MEEGGGPRLEISRLLQSGGAGGGRKREEEVDEKSGQRFFIRFVVVVRPGLQPAIQKKRVKAALVVCVDVERRGEGSRQH